MKSLGRMYGRYSNTAWARVLAEGRGEGLPPMPDEEIQRQFVGVSGMDAFADPAAFMDLVVRTARSRRARLKRDSRILDIGVGWGRFYRWLLRDFEVAGLVGVDVDPEMIRLCGAAMPYGDFRLVDPMPPYDFENASFELIMLYSVFSHLSEAACLSLMDEIFRLLKEGGFVAFTTLKEAHLDVWAAQSKAGIGIYDAVGGHPDESRRKMQQGEFLFVATGGGDESRPNSFYGEAIISRSCLTRMLPRWPADLVLVSDERRLRRAIITLQKRRSRK